MPLSFDNFDLCMPLVNNEVDKEVLCGVWTATSKLGLMGDIESSTKSLGFRGEALGSLADVSLVEVRTKARGKPNAYHKIIKACIFFGFWKFLWILKWNIVLLIYFEDSFS